MGVLFGRRCEPPGSCVRDVVRVVRSAHDILRGHSTVSKNLELLQNKPSAGRYSPVLTPSFANWNEFSGGFATGCVLIAPVRP